MSEKTVIHKGLEGVIVDTTRISKVDGESGTLIYRGVDINELIQRRFEDVVFLVIVGRFPSDEEAKELSQLLSENSQLAENEIQLLKSIDPSTHPMKVLQGIVPILHISNSYEYKILRDSLCPEGIAGLILASKIPTVLAHYHRLRNKRDIIGEKLGQSFHEKFLYQFTGKRPSKDFVAILDATQILQMEHGFNASTFAARVTASTLSSVECAVSAAIGTLFGKLHGGADQAALEMMLEIGSPEKAASFVKELLAKKGKIMGMGHRVYRVVDPRAKILKPLAKDLCMGTPFEQLYLTFEAVEQTMFDEMAKLGKAIKANVEFYKGPVFYAMGIPTEYFTSLFVMSRVFGYLAHILESRVQNKMIRPKALYIGEPRA